MSQVELFVYVYLALGVFYVVAMSIGMYLSVKMNLPLFGMPAPPPIPKPPRIAAHDDKPGARA